jgi:hypothetical protein
MIISASAKYYATESLKRVFDVVNDSNAAYQFDGDTTRL